LLARDKLFPFVERIISDGGYQGPTMAAAVARTGTWSLQIVRRSDLHKFVVLPLRWRVKRIFAWISQCRRMARDTNGMPARPPLLSASP